MMMASLEMKSEEELWETLTESERKAFLKSVQTGMQWWWWWLEKGTSEVIPYGVWLVGQRGWWLFEFQWTLVRGSQRLCTGGAVTALCRETPMCA